MFAVWSSLILPLALAASPNLLDNGGFEAVPPRGTAPEGWQLPTPPDGFAGVDATLAKSGRRSLRITVGAESPLDWYSAWRTVKPIKRGATYTLSVQVRSSETTGGAGAYISLNAFDGAGKRIGVFDSGGKLQGTVDWKLITVTAKIPDGTSELRAIVCLHGYGTAWFDEVQVEEGDSASGFRTSESDRAALAKLAGDEVEAAPWLKTVPARPTGRGRLAVLDLGSAARDVPGTRAASDPARLVALLKAAGHAAVLLTPAQLANEVYCDPERFDVIVLPAGDLFPLVALRGFLRYLQRGGAFLSTGGMAFDTPVVEVKGKWYSPRSLPPADGPQTPILTDTPAGWQPSTNRAEKPLLAPCRGPRGEPGVELSTPELSGWDTAIAPPQDGKLPAGWSTTRLWARGDANTSKLWVEWSEVDGSRWHKAITVGPTWQEYAIGPGEFSYWHDNQSVGRGGDNDSFQPANASRLQVGVATDLAGAGKPHRFAVAGIRVQLDKLAAQRVTPPSINTRYAVIRDAMWPKPEQLGVFDPGFPLRRVTRLTGEPVAPQLAAFRADGDWRGWAATAMLGLNGHGFGPNRARWVPLLTGRDRHGQPQGPVAAVVHHYTGTFAGSSWAIFGLTNRDLFDGRLRGAGDVLSAAVDNLLRRCYLGECESAWACYRRGESAILRTKVNNAGRLARAVEVVIRLGHDADSPVLRRVPLKLEPGQSAAIEAKQEVPVGPEQQTFAFELVADGRVIDRELGLYVIQPPDWQGTGPAVTCDGARFKVDGRAQLLMGCQTYWGQNGSVTARLPINFDRDFRAMRNMGLKWTRLFMPFKTEEDKRISDAVVTLAGRYGLLLYHTPNLTNTADPAQLAEQAKTAEEIAERYRGCPHVLVDICNEPSFHAKDAALIKSFGREPKTDGPFADLDVAAWVHHMAKTQRAWAAANLAAVHRGDAKRLASVGWSQGWGWLGGDLKDPLLASLDLDFTDRHYYGRPDQLGPELKDVDLRGLGKPLILGECGAKNHPTFAERDPWNMGDDDTRYDRRFLYLGHHAFGLGAAVVSGWHWRDPMEGIFPCGLVNSTGAPRPTAFAYRAMALAFGRFQPGKIAPRVCLLLPDNARQGGQRDTLIRAIHRASELLIAARVDFTLLPDSALDRLPLTCKAVVYPVPTAPEDTVLEQLAAFAQNGGAVYLSGDAAFDGQRRAAPPERLTRLCGVKATGEATAAPLKVPPAAGELQAVGNSGLPAGPAHPLRALELAGADAVASCGGRPVVTRFALGQGQVWLSVDPIELSGTVEPWHRALYSRFLTAARTPGLAIKPDRPEVQAYRLAGDNGEAWFFHNTGAATTVTVGPWSLDLASDGFGYLQTGLDGALRVAEAQGTIACAGRELVRITGHAFVMAEDDQEPVRTRTLVICPLTAGEVRVRTTATAVVKAESGELNDGRFVAYEPLPAGVRDGWMSVRTPVDQPRVVIRVGLR